MKKLHPEKPNPFPAPLGRGEGFWSKEGPALGVLALSLLFYFKDWVLSPSKVFLSLDMTVVYYPLYHWVHQHLAEGRLPLISDMAYHGAPVAAVSMVGVLSPFLWLFHFLPNFTRAFNLLFIAPTVLYLFGAYFLGRRLDLSRTASLLLSFLWTYNGHQAAQLDHLNVAWAHAFFPWAFLTLLKGLENGRMAWSLLAGLLLALGLLSGHPQVFFLECLFFLFWALLYRSGRSWVEKITAVGTMLASAVAFASPLILFTRECLSDGFPQWGDVDRFYHSWTPLNLLTLVFPWFFGRDQYDRAGGDYWWQYQFVEMQVAFSVAGLFFILLFFFYRGRHRRFVAATGLFAVLMALGKFFFVYPLVQPLPVFSFFRDPSRYWFLATWVLGLGAAWAWEEWFEKGNVAPFGRKLCVSLGVFSLGILFAGWLLLNPGRPLLEGAANGLIRHFLLNDGLHDQSLASYLGRLPEKWSALAFNLDIRHPRVFLPLLFLLGLALAVFNRRKWNLPFQKGLLLLLVFADLMVFRMPLGNAFYSPSGIPSPQYPKPENRTLTLLYKNVSPLPSQYGEMAYPNMNFVSGYPNLVLDANPSMARYDRIFSELGWFSWVYKERDPLGFSRRVDLLKKLGVDQIVSDTPLKLPLSFKTVQDRYPYVYKLDPASPKAFLEAVHDNAEKTPLETIPTIQAWGETQVTLSARPNHAAFLVLQKTWLPGWKAFANGKPIQPCVWQDILTSVPLEAGENNVKLKFDPESLRLGFFLFFLTFGTLASLAFKHLLA